MTHQTLSYVQYCNKCGGTDPNCINYNVQPHYVTSNTDLREQIVNTILEKNGDAWSKAELIEELIEADKAAEYRRGYDAGYDWGKSDATNKPVSPNDTTTPTDTPNQPTGTAADVLDELYGVKTYPVFDSRKHQAAHQLYLAELERIGSDEITRSMSSTWRNQLRAELREKARLFYGQDKEEV